MKVRFRARALRDLKEIHRYLDERSPIGARNVLSAIHRAIISMADQPLAAPQTSDPDVRVKIVGRFRYKVFYSVTDSAIEVLHIRHAARRPWDHKQ